MMNRNQSKKNLENLNFDEKLSHELDWTLLYAKFNSFLPAKVSSLTNFKPFFSIFLITLNQKEKFKEEYEVILNKTISSFNCNKAWREFSGFTKGYHYEFDKELFSEAYLSFEINSQFKPLSDDLNLKKSERYEKLTANMPTDVSFTPIQATECIFSMA